MNRICMQFVLEAMTPISHAEGVIGNHSMLATRLQRQPDGSFVAVPVISADTMRHGLRETGAILCLDAAGLLKQEGGPQLTEAALRLLFSGGMLTGRGDASTIKLDHHRQMTAAFPILGILGGCADAAMIPGKIHVSDARMMCAETAHAAWPWATNDKALAPMSQQIEHCNRVRFDVTRDRAKQALLSSAAVESVERRLLAKDAAHEQDDHKEVGKDRGRPMPHSFEAAAAGSLWTWELTGNDLTDVERAVLISSLALMFETWRFGGKRGTGHGKLRPVSCRDVRLPNLAPEASSADVDALGSSLIGIVQAHMQTHKDALRVLLNKGGCMTPVCVRAKLSGGIMGPRVMLDGLLASVFARQMQLPPIGVQTEEQIAAANVALRQEVAKVLLLDAGGFFHCSDPIFEVERHEGRFVSRRFPVDRAASLGDERKIRRVNLTTGMTKTFRLPMSVVHLRGDELMWYARADFDALREMLPWVDYLGKKRSVGCGRVASWSTETCDAWDGFPVLRDGRPLRALPLDYPGLTDHTIEMRALTFPYWEYKMSNPAPAPDLLYLPGWRSTLRITPLRWPMDLHGSLGLHGALHLLANVGHDTERAACQRPLIVLCPREPTEDGKAERWDAHWLHPESQKLAGGKYPVEIFGAVRRVEIGEFLTMAVPIPNEGTRTVSVRGITPLLVKRTGGSFSDRLRFSDWLGSLHQSIRRFMGAQPWLTAMHLEYRQWECCKVTTDTRWSGGPVVAFWWHWKGTVNAEGLLALRVIEQLGMGSTVSRGFGRIEVTEC